MKCSECRMAELIIDRYGRERYLCTDDMPDSNKPCSQNWEPEDEYIPSASAGDYSPSNPWDAPGMSVRDFI